MKTKFIETQVPSGKKYPLCINTWGEKNPHTLFCVHGLSGNSLDFKFLAEHLASKENYRVVAIDIAGRGQSAYYDDPNDYNFEQYLADIDLALVNIGCDKPKSCDWLGVSMGGLLGYYIAARNNSPINDMILSDIGPEVPQADLDLIYKVFSTPVDFETLDDVIAALKVMYKTPYSRGPLTEEQWRYYATTSYKEKEHGGYTRNSDPNIIYKFDTNPLGKYSNLWHLWEKTTQAVLALRGADSTLFPQGIAQKMLDTKRGAKMDLVEITDCGHVPSLYRQDQIDIIANWLRQAQAPQAA